MRHGRVAQAIWEGDVNWLQRHAPCRCCCAEHTFEDCPARLWFGYRGQNTLTFADEERWALHYMVHHGMTLQEFFDVEPYPGLNPVRFSRIKDEARAVAQKIRATDPLGADRISCALEEAAP